MVIRIGILRRAKQWFTGLRQRASDWFHKETHKERLEELQAKSFKNPNHREKRAELDPIIYALVTRVANSITARPPIFLDKQGNEMDDLKEQWKKLLYSDLLNDVIQATRTHGYMVLETNVEGLDDDRNWLVHDSTDIQMIIFNKFKIEQYTVLPLIDEGEKVSLLNTVIQYDLFPKDVIHFYVGKFKLNRQGVSPIKPIWDNAVRYSEIIGAMSRYDSRIGNGMMVVSVDPMTYQGETSRLASAIESTNTKNFLILKHPQNSGMATTIDWEGSSTRVWWDIDLGEIMKLISGATGFNVRWFIGDPKGAQSSSKEDKIANYETLESIFEEYTSFIRKLLLMQEDGEALNESVADIQWDSGGVLDADDADEVNKSNEGEEESLEAEVREEQSEELRTRRIRD
ncbi:hypothetical protein LCGC14_1107280 [marine sediment metagenome]|uniref:Phage portal protein n=1 Tax=marine sediment metagenome TaxID=412755 RepID=A0A0F9PQZ4_9ZZZZ